MQSEVSTKKIGAFDLMQRTFNRKKSGRHVILRSCHIEVGATSKVDTSKMKTTKEAR